jgi:hypothetical protein
LLRPQITASTYIVVKVMEATWKVPTMASLPTWISVGGSGHCDCSPPPNHSSSRAQVTPCPQKCDHRRGGIERGNACTSHQGGRADTIDGAGTGKVAENFWCTGVQNDDQAGDNNLQSDPQTLQLCLRSTQTSANKLQQPLICLHMQCGSL